MVSMSVDVASFFSRGATSAARGAQRNGNYVAPEGDEDREGGGAFEMHGGEA